LFLDDGLEKAKNLKLVLSAFEKLSGLKINFHKSELFSFRETKERVSDYVEHFGCNEGTWPFMYLGIPMSPRKFFNKDWKGVQERFHKKLSSWKGLNLCSLRRCVLEDFSLFSSCAYSVATLLGKVLFGPWLVGCSIDATVFVNACCMAVIHHGKVLSVGRP
jgi:hypothetical protein